jgi:hypothetical protein
MAYFKKYLCLIGVGLLLSPIYVSAEKDYYIARFPDSTHPASFSSEQKRVSENNQLKLKEKKFRTSLLISSAVLGTTVYGATAWWEGSSSTFRVRHEDWFGADTPTGGADKLGHAYSFYVSTRVLISGFEWAGHNRRKAAQLAGITSAGLSVGIEIIDGFTEKYGFSTEDMIMNLSGIGAGVFLENYPQWDDLFDIRLKYWLSDDARRLNDYDPLADYSGQTYLLITKLSGIPLLRKQPFLRYLELAIGYGTRGYQPTDGTGKQPRERNFYYGLSLNLSLLLNDWVFKKHSRTQKVTENVLEYLQMPGTALLFEHNL